MTAVGGSIEEISVDGRLFPVPSDADANLKLGGFENEVASNGNGSARKLMSRVPWAIDGLTVEIDSDRADLEFLQGVANAKEFVTITITFASGVTYQATGTVGDELQGSTQSATASLSLNGPGEATQQ